MDNDLSHLNDSGQAIMVNVSDKQVTRRKASACAIIVMNPETLNQILDSKIPKDIRHKIPILTNDKDDIIWVYGQRIAHFYRVTNKTKNILFVQGNREINY